MSFLLFLFLSSMASLVVKTGIPLILILYAWAPVVKFKVVHLQHWSVKNMATFHVANMHHLAKNHSSTDACMPFYEPLRLLMYKFYLHHHYFYRHNYYTIAGWSCAHSYMRICFCVCICVCRYIVFMQGADINPLDKERRSPLLLASSRGGWRTVQTLIRLGANIHLKDVNSRNVLHLVVMNGGRLEEFADQVIKVRKCHYLTHSIFIGSTNDTI